MRYVIVLVLLLSCSLGWGEEEKIDVTYRFVVDNLVWQYKGKDFKDFTELIRAVNKEIALTEIENSNHIVEGREQNQRKKDSEKIFEGKYSNNCEKLRIEHCWVKVGDMPIDIIKQNAPENILAYNSGYCCVNCGIIKLNYAVRREIFIYNKEVWNRAIKYYKKEF